MKFEWWMLVYLFIGYIVIAGGILIFKKTIALLKDKQYKEIFWGFIAVLVFIMFAVFGYRYP